MPDDLWRVIERVLAELDPPAHKNHTGTDCGCPSARTVVSHAIASSRNRLSARPPASVVVSSARTAPSALA
jgi:hypothetical protein